MVVSNGGGEMERWYDVTWAQWRRMDGGDCGRGHDSLWLWWWRRRRRNRLLLVVGCGEYSMRAVVRR